ncbi:MAG: tetratricopeptide repeat protein [Arenimonas sp.]
MSICRSVIFTLGLFGIPATPSHAQTLASVNAQLEAQAPAALTSAEAFAKANAASGDAWIALTRARLQAGKAESAIDAAEKATRLAPNNSQSFYWLGNAYGSRIGQVGMFSKMSMAPKLRDAFEHAVALDPNNLDNRSALMEFYLQAPSVIGGGIDKARVQASEIGKRDKSQGFMAQGRIAMQEKKGELALKFYEAALASKPGDARARVATAVAYQELKRWPDAFRLLRAWTAEDPKAGVAWYQIGRASALSGQFLDEGAAALQRYLTLPHGKNEPKKQHALYRLAQVDVRAGRKEQARVALNEALRIDPEYVEAKAELAKL